jgi:hypothetical protein
MQRIIIILLLFCLSANNTSTAGGGWTQPKGKGYFKLDQSMILANRYFAPDGNVIDITTIGLYTTSLYGEYGLTDRITVIAYVPFFVRNTLNTVRFEPSGRENPGDALNAFGDTDIQLQYGFLKTDTWVASARILFGIPFGVVGGGESGILQTGDGEFNQMLRLDLSRPLGNKVWTSAYVGYNNRTNDFSDEWRFGAELGIRFSERNYLQSRVDVVQSTFNGTATPAEGNSIFANNVEFVSPALELGFQTKKGLGFTLSAAGAFSARNILAAPNIAAGVFYKLSR